MMPTTYYAIVSGSSLLCVLLLPLLVAIDVQARYITPYTFDGDIAGDQFGYSVSGAGDVSIGGSTFKPKGNA